MGVEKIEVRDVNRDKEILEKLVTLDVNLKALDVKVDSMQTDITKIKDDVAAKP